MRVDPEATLGAGRLHQAVHDAAIIADVAVESFHLHTQTLCHYTTFFFHVMLLSRQKIFEIMSEVEEIENRKSTEIHEEKRRFSKIKRIKTQ